MIPRELPPSHQVRHISATMPPETVLAVAAQRKTDLRRPVADIRGRLHSGACLVSECSVPVTGTTTGNEAVPIVGPAHADLSRNDPRMGSYKDISGGNLNGDPIPHYKTAVKHI